MLVSILASLCCCFCISPLFGNYHALAQGATSGWPHVLPQIILFIVPLSFPKRCFYIVLFAPGAIHVGIRLLMLMLSSIVSSKGCLRMRIFLLYSLDFMSALPLASTFPKGLWIKMVLVVLILCIVVCTLTQIVLCSLFTIKLTPLYFALSMSLSNWYCTRPNAASTAKSGSASLLTFPRPVVYGHKVRVHSLRPFECKYSGPLNRWYVIISTSCFSCTNVLRISLQHRGRNAATTAVSLHGSPDVRLLRFA